MTAVKKAGAGRAVEEKCGVLPLSCLCPLKYRATCFLMVDVLGPLSCWTAGQMRRRRLGEGITIFNSFAAVDTCL